MYFKATSFPCKILKSEGNRVIFDIRLILVSNKYLIEKKKKREKYEEEERNENRKNILY